MLIPNAIASKYPTIIGDNYALITGDCSAIIPQLQDARINFVFTDPPYNVGKDYGDYQDNLPENEYKQWMQQIVSLSKQVSQNKIAFYVGGKLTSMFFELIPDAHLIIVHKRAIGVMSGNYFLQYHSLFSTAKPLTKTKDLWDDIRIPGEGYFFKEQRYDHPGLTSLALTKRVINTFTSPGDIILDPFSGTGTTAIACLQLNRNFIGIELNPQYTQTATKRIKQELAQTKMSLK